MLNQIKFLILILTLTTVNSVSAEWPKTSQNVSLFGKVYEAGTLQIEQDNADIIMYNDDHASHNTKEYPHLWYIKDKKRQVEWLELEYDLTENGVKKIGGNTHFKLNDAQGNRIIELHYEDFKRTQDNTEFNYPFRIILNNGTFTGTLTKHGDTTVDLLKDGNEIGIIRFADCYIEGACFTIKPTFN